jgi:hypothetical protein
METDHCAERMKIDGKEFGEWIAVSVAQIEKRTAEQSAVILEVLRTGKMMPLGFDHTTISPDLRLTYISQ